MNITKNHAVSINYTLTNDKGEILDKSDGTPLVYLQGFSNIIPGLENALEGKVKGDKLQVSIEPKDAYGTRNDQLVQKVPRNEFDSDGGPLEVGVQFQMDTPNGSIILTAIEVTDEHVVLDGNHPLAGEHLNFDVEVMDVRAATEDELSHGHVHGPSCNH